MISLAAFQLARRAPHAPPPRRRASVPAPVALRSPAAPPSPRPARSGRRAAARPPGRSARSSRQRGRRRSGRRRFAASQARSGLLVGISPKRRTRSGSTERGEALVAQQLVVGRRSTWERSWGPQRSCEVGSARIGKPEARASWASGSRSSGSSWRPATITPEIGVADVAGDLVEQEGRGLEVDRRHRGQRPPVPALQRQRVGRGHRALDRDRRQRLAPGRG